jgi:2-keto-4-pentenoate hydratase/2-oxohepta-3-ene-1,7-dioic acid hydratase in catechol pathway
MRIANVSGRAALTDGTHYLDIHDASEGRFGPDPMDLFGRWDQVRQWADTVDPADGRPVDHLELGTPVPRPRQVFAIGLNYRDHADEASLPYPEHLFVFTKFASCLAGPNVDVLLPAGEVDYETELVVTIGREVHGVDESEALEAVAGYSVGQDYSERTMQLRPPVPQFSLGKSYPNFGPFGPAIVTPDELSDPANLRVTAVLEGPGAEDHGDSGWRVQDGTTADMIFPVARIISDLSRVTTLYPGDVLFTGTPAGVGKAHGISLQPGNVLTSTIEGIGSIRNAFIAHPED